MTALRSLVLLLVAGCAASDAPGGAAGPFPPAPGDAFLTIVGASETLVAGGAPTELVVRYHDGADRPLAGAVGFTILGDPRGGDVSAESASTDDDGVARVNVIPGFETTFTVTASAPYAEPVTWTVTIGPGGNPLRAAGVYTLESRFDLVGGVPGPVGDIINGLLDMTDGPNDPSTWLIDQILVAIDNPAITAAVDGLRPGLDISLNTTLLEVSPDFVSTVIRVADDLGQVARRFGTVSTLTIEYELDRGMWASHAIDTFRFDVEGATHELALDEPSRAEDIAAILQGKTRLSLDRHELPVAYGKLLVLVLDEVIVPAIAPGATDLGELLAELVDCARVGEWLAGEIGVGPPLVYDIACRTALSVGGALIEEQLQTLDGPAILAIGGEARPADESGDGAIDRLQPGVWEGELRLGESASALDRPAQTWSGVRE